MQPRRAASKGPLRTSLPSVLGALGQRRAAGGEHRLPEVLHVSLGESDSRGGLLPQTHGFEG
jgi:hypothetical protein